MTESATQKSTPIAETPVGFPTRIFPRLVSGDVRDQSHSDSLFWKRVLSLPREDTSEDCEVTGQESPGELKEKLRVQQIRAQEKLEKLERIIAGIKLPFFADLESAMMEVVFFIDHTELWEAMRSGNAEAVNQLVIKREGIMAFFEGFGSVSKRYEAKRAELEATLNALKERHEQAATLDEQTH